MRNHWTTRIHAYSLGSSCPTTLEASSKLLAKLTLPHISLFSLRSPWLLATFFLTLHSSPLQLEHPH